MQPRETERAAGLLAQEGQNGRGVFLLGLPNPHFPILPPPPQEKTQAHTHKRSQRVLADRAALSHPIQTAPALLKEACEAEIQQGRLLLSAQKCLPGWISAAPVNSENAESLVKRNPVKCQGLKQLPPGPSVAFRPRRSPRCPSCLALSGGLPVGHPPTQLPTK